MEDAATAEIARSQVWQWLHNDVFDRALVERVVDEEVARIRDTVGDEAFAKSRYDDARTLFVEVALADDYVDFLTLPAYALMP
jgi:malate synthase